MDQILSDLSEPAVIESIELNMFAYHALLQHWPQAEVYDDTEMLQIVTGIPIPFFNGVFRVQLEPENVNAAIEAALTRSKARHAPILWQTSPSNRPDNLASYLAAHGFVYEGDTPGMAIDLHELDGRLFSPSQVTVKRVTDPETMSEYCRTACAGFGMPDSLIGPMIEWGCAPGFAAQAPVCHYIGWLNDEPVATSSMVLSAGVAGIYNVTTIPTSRRRGAGSAVTRKALLEARAMGYRVGTLQASKMGVSVYRQLGFREYFKLGNYAWKPEPTHN